MAWLPALTAVIPLASCSGDRVETLVIAPRALKVPVFWNSSSFSTTSVSAPARAATSGPRQTWIGVSATCGRLRSRVARTVSMSSVRVWVMARALEARLAALLTRRGPESRARCGSEGRTAALLVVDAAQEAAARQAGVDGGVVAALGGGRAGHFTHQA